ncbi:MAG: 2-keto-4-pentenoate hydratase [Proteobacteria bacterium]|nr:2-keto-4-pentenoate hydratase [Pseudomonadota bacterium]
MKLASLRKGRDGQLIVVSKDGSRYLTPSINTLQQALDDWAAAESELLELYQKLNQDSSLGDPIVLSELTAPLPRAYEWIDGSAYINHIVLVRKARNAEPPATLLTDPLVYQGGSGVLLGPTDDIVLHDEQWGLDFESEVCVILKDTPLGTKGADVDQHVQLLMLCNDITLRNLIPPELKKGFGFFNSKPATAFSPFAITPDELGEHWKEGRIHLNMRTVYNGEVFGDVEAGPEMHFSFRDIVGHVAKTRSFTAGTIVGSGTVSNKDVSKGSSCLSEKRMLEKINTGEFVTPYMKVGDTVEIDMLDSSGLSVFGKISQTVVSPQ